VPLGETGVGPVKKGRPDFFPGSPRYRRGPRNREGIGIKSTTGSATNKASQDSRALSSNSLLEG
jgi:hypothetical protein